MRRRGGQGPAGRVSLLRTTGHPCYEAGGGQQKKRGGGAFLCKASFLVRRARSPFSSPRTPAAASGAGFGGAQPPSNWFVLPKADTCARDVLRQNAQDSPAVQPAIQAPVDAGRVKMSYAERAAETNGPIYQTVCLWQTKGCNGRVPSPPQSVLWQKVFRPWERQPVQAPAFAPSIVRSLSARYRWPAVLPPPRPCAFASGCLWPLEAF